MNRMKSKTLPFRIEIYIKLRARFINTSKSDAERFTANNQDSHVINHGSIGIKDKC